jgi:hypothetical protein
MPVGLSPYRGTVELSDIPSTFPHACFHKYNICHGVGVHWMP